MKHFILFVVMLIIAAGVAVVVYPMVSPYHARLRADFSDPAKRGSAIRQAIGFEKMHYHALLGNKEAEYAFGLALSSGELGFTDSTAAASWFKRAADQAYPLAEYAMAHCLFTGDGVPQDVDAAAVWAQKAAEKKTIPQTRELMGLLYAGGIGEQQDLMRGLDLLKTGQSSEALQIASSMDAKFKEVYALPKEQQDAALQKMAADVKADVHSKFPAMEKKLAADALVPPPDATAMPK